MISELTTKERVRKQEVDERSRRERVCVYVKPYFAPRYGCKEGMCLDRGNAAKPQPLGGITAKALNQVLGY